MIYWVWQRLGGRQRRRRAAGLCAQCNKSVVDGQTRCVDHQGKVDVGGKLLEFSRTMGVAQEDKNNAAYDD